MSRSDDRPVGLVDARCDSAQQAAQDVELASFILSKVLGRC